MKRWEEIKNNIQSFNQNEIEEIEIVAKFVNRIVDRRKELGLSQRDLAEMVGIKQAAIARFERAGVVPRMDTFLKIIKPLGLLVELTENKRIASPEKVENTMKDYLVRTIERDCPICNRIHSLEERSRITQAVVKGEVVEYEEKYYLCSDTDEDENEFVPAGLMDENLQKARNAYRLRKSLQLDE
ncbi:antitoxin HipB [Peptococcaceae bacterium CEB3]|nr:antitoxin HipB [Peptococcaceae bacterium CEB3]